MNLMFLLVIVIHIQIWYTVNSSWLKNDLHRALLYNPETEKLEDVISDNKKTKCLPCITACPAESDIDKEFTKKYSRSRNGVFLRDVYEKSKPRKVETEICEFFFEPTIFFDQTTLTYETGYELYYPEGTIDLPRRKYSYDDFLLIYKIPANLKKPKLPSTKTSLISADKKTWVFYWIPVLSLKFNPSKYQIRVRIKNDTINDYRDIRIKRCPSYDMGNVLYKLGTDKNVNLFKSEYDQLNLFDVLFIPFELKQNPKEGESPYVQSYGGFEKAHLVPLMFFHTGAAKDATCTLLNVIPVWTSILNGQLKRIDQYLYTIFRMWSPHVNIIFGVSGLSKVNVSDRWMLEKNQFVKENDQTTFELKYPKLIYRVVEYGTPDNLSNVVIVIHNDRTATRKNKICDSTPSTWEFINNDDPKTGVSYACTITQLINKQLGIYDDLSKYVKTFQLMTMDSMVKGKGKLPDQRDNIKREMMKLFPGQIFPEEEIDMNTYDKDNSSPEVEYKEQNEQEPWPESKYQIQKTPEPEFTYEYPKDGRFWILPIDLDPFDVEY